MSAHFTPASIKLTLLPQGIRASDKELASAAKVLARLCPPVPSALQGRSAGTSTASVT